MNYGEVIIRSKDGSKIAHSRNLRGVMDRARKLHALGHTRLSATRIDNDEGVLWAVFPDDSYACIRFASFGILNLWIKQRITHGKGKFVTTT